MKEEVLKNVVLKEGQPKKGNFAQEKTPYKLVFRRHHPFEALFRNVGFESNYV